MEWLSFSLLPPPSSLDMWLWIGLAVGILLGLVIGIGIGFSLYARAGTWD